MLSSWIVVENTEQAEAASTMLQESPHYQCLSTSPTAYYYLARRSLPIVSLHTYLTYEELNRIAELNAEIAARVCARLDEALRITKPGLPIGFKPFDALLYQFKHAMDALSFRYQELVRFCQAEQPDELFFWVSSEGRLVELEHELSGGSHQPFLWQPAESLTASLLQEPNWSERCGVRLVSLPPPGSPVAEKRQKATVLKRCLGKVLNPNRIGGFRTLGLSDLGLERKGLPTLVILDAGRDVLAFLDDAISRRDVAVDWWTHWGANPVSLRTGLEVRLTRAESLDLLHNWNQITAEAMIDRAWPSIDGDLPEPVSRVLKARLVGFALKRIPVLASLHQRALLYFRNRQPLAALCGTTTGDAIQVIAQAARQTGVSVVSFQHGGVYGYAAVPSLPHSDLKAPEVLCTYGDSVTETLARQAQECSLPVEVVTVGWYRQGQVCGVRFGKRRRPKQEPGRLLGVTEKPVLLYVATGLVSNMRYGPYHWCDDTAYFLHQTELARLLAEQAEFEVVFKLHYKDKVHNPLRDYLKDHGLGYIHVLQQMPLSSLLPQADVVLIDWPSTTLLEALAMNRRVIYLDLGLLQWVLEGARRLEKSAWWIDKRTGWQDQLRRALEQVLDGQWILLDDGFSEAYASAEYRPDQLWTALDQRAMR